MGRRFFDFLKRMDERIVKRMAQVQRNGGLPSKDTKYREWPPPSLVEVRASCFNEGSCLDIGV